jgi:hypothetical protein
MEANKQTILYMAMTLLALDLVYSRSFLGTALGFVVGVLTSDRVKAWVVRGRIQYLIHKQRWSGTLTQPAMSPPPN